MSLTNTPAPAQKAVLTGDEIRSIWIEHGLDDEAVEDFARAIESALLSKLRAPVASAEVMDALNWVDDFIARCNRDDRGSCESVNVLRRALASAPVAPQACPTDVCQAGQADGVLCANDECDRANGVRPASAPVAGEAAIYLDAGHLREVWAGNDMPVSASTEPGHGMVLYYAAPQGGKAYTYARNLAVTMWEKRFKQDAPEWKPCEDLIGVLTQIDNMVAGLVVPQASEAVRSYTLDEVFGPLEALEIARSALMEIADLADVEADQRGVIVNRALTKIDKLTAAALSAQPGAQKNGGSDGR